MRILIHGVSGRMGREVLAAVHRDPDHEIVAGVRHSATGDSYPLPDGSGAIPLHVDAAAAIAASHPDVMVDFTSSAALMGAAREALPRGVHVVTGTTGLAEGDLQELDSLARGREVGVVVAPNFALGAVLLIHLAETVGRFFDYAEVTEAHHEAKIDAPSGTALAIARALAAGRGSAFTRPTPEREPIPGSRGGELDGVGLHASRMPGRLAHHEVVLGTAGQTLSLRHDTINRECYMPGVLAAIRQVVQYRGLVLGLDKILGL